MLLSVSGLPEAKPCTLWLAELNSVVHSVMVVGVQEAQ